MKDLKKLFLEKPHFYIRDLDNYTTEFLINIILWYTEYIQLLKQKIKRIQKNKKSD